MKQKIAFLGFITILISMLYVPAFAGGTAISVNSPEYLKPGDSFYIDVMITDPTYLQAIQFDLTFDSSKLEIVRQEGKGYFQPGEILSKFLILPGNTLANGNTISFAAAYQGTSGISNTGSKSLGKIYFRALKEGEARFTLKNVKMLDSSENNLPFTLTNGITKVDGTAPVATAKYPQEGQYITTNIVSSIEVAVSDALVGIDKNSLKLTLQGKTVSPSSYENNVAKFAWPDTLAEGSHTASFEAKDLAGNITNYNWSFTVDTVAPNAPAISETTNPINNNNQGAVLVKGTPEAGALVDISFTDSTSKSVSYEVYASGEGAFFQTANLALLADGDILVKVNAIDLAGNISQPTVVTLQKQTELSAPTLQISDKINASNYKSLTFNGTGQPNATVVLNFSNGTNVITNETLIDEAGNFVGAVDLTNLADGNIKLSYFVKDSSGKTSVAQEKFLQKDTVVKINSAWQSAKKALIIDDELIITVIGEKQGNLSYQLGSITGNISELSEGFYQATIKIDAQMPELIGEPLTVGFIDPFGNKKELQLGLVTIITSKPEIFSVSHTVKEAFKAGDQLVITMTGTADSKASVSIGNLVTKAPMKELNPGTGIYTFAYTVPENINGQDIAITGFIEDIAGNQVEMADPNLVIFDSINPVSTYKLTPSIPNGSNGFYKTQVTLELMSEAGSTIYFKINGGQEQKGTSPLSMTFDKDGTYNVEFYAIDIAGNREAVEAQKSLSLKVKTSIPNAPQVTFPTLKTKESSISAMVYSLPNSLVEVYRQSWKVGQGLTDGNGIFNFKSLPLKEGANSFAARVTNEAGTKSNYSAPISVNRDSEGPEFYIAMLKDINDVVNVTIYPSEPLATNPGVKVTLDGAPIEINDLAFVPTENVYTGWFEMAGSSEVSIEVSGVDDFGNVGTGFYSETIVIEGEETSLNESAGILIPQGALGLPQQFSSLSSNSIVITATSRVLEQQELANLADSQPINVVKFGPAMNFGSDITISLKYDPNLDPSKLGIYYLAGDTWVNFGEKVVSKDNGLIKFNTNHFSTYGIFADHTPPVLEVVNPQDKSATSQSTIEIIGKTESNVSVSVEVYGGAKFAGNADESGNFTISGVTLVENAINTIAVTATDSYGNTATDTFTIENDSKEPTLTITSPNNITVGTNSIQLTGNFEANAEAWLIVNDNEAAATSLGTSSDINTTVILDKEGSNSIKVRVIDHVGNYTEQTINVNKDTTAPALQIAGLKEGMTTSSQQLTIAGLSESGASLSISVNGTYVVQGIPLEAQEFNQTVALTAEENVVIVEAIDASGNKATRKYTVYYDNLAPSLEVASPLESYMVTPYASVAIDGLTSADAIVTVSVKNSNGTFGKQLANVEGKFNDNLDLALGKNVITLTSAGVGATEKVFEVNFVDQGGFVRGNVFGQGAKPRLLSDAEIVIRNQNNNYNLQTNEQGFFEEKHLVPGSYKVIAKKRGYLPKLADAQVATGKILPVDFTLRFGDFVYGDIETEGSAIDLYDIMRIVKLFGIEQGYSDKWDEMYDYLVDGVVDLYDIMPVVKNFGEEYLVPQE